MEHNNWARKLAGNGTQQLGKETNRTIEPNNWAIKLAGQWNPAIRQGNLELDGLK